MIKIRYVPDWLRNALSEEYYKTENKNTATLCYNLLNEASDGKFQDMSEDQQVKATIRCNIAVKKNGRKLTTQEVKDIIDAVIIRGY